jgi:DNA-binding MarR family transcriptional regulator
MDRYTLTYEAKARLRAMETRADIDASANTLDFRLLRYLYNHGPATIEEIEKQTGLHWDGVVNEISVLMNRGYVEGVTTPQ